MRFTPVFVLSTIAFAQTRPPEVEDRIRAAETVFDKRERSLARAGLG
jgi:hypothetical protein